MMTTNEFIAAAGHFGSGDKNVIKNYVESLGFKYISAKTKDEFDSLYGKFVSDGHEDKPILFEVFTKDYDDRKAFDIMCSIDVPLANPAEQVARQLLGKKGINAVKKLIGR